MPSFYISRPAVLENDFCLRRTDPAKEPPRSDQIQMILKYSRDHNILVGDIIREAGLTELRTEADAIIICDMIWAKEKKETGINKIVIV